MQIMLDTATMFVNNLGLEFSTHEDPAKFKSKAIFMVGRHVTLTNPVNLTVCDKPLPWVRHATHLGHEFNEDGTFDMDIRQKEAAFISKSTEVREVSFAAPPDVLSAIKLYATDMYGAILCPLCGHLATVVMNTWGVCVKLS